MNPNELDSVLKYAKALGNAIVNSGAFSELKSAEKDMEQDPAVQTLRVRIQELKDEAHNELNQGANSVQGKNTFDQIEEYQQMMIALPSVQRTMLARQSFSEMMNHVNQIMEKAIMGDEMTTPCNGNCAGCKGCAVSR